MKVIVAITAASGAIYARQCLELLLASPTVEQIALIMSDKAPSVLEWEGVALPKDERIIHYANNDMFAPPASGSASYDAMIIAPCSVGTLARIASGISDSLLTRAADVQLKERRALTLLVRETPLSLIHLRNMTTLTECGAVVMPACPSFYGEQLSMEEMCRQLCARALRTIGVECPLEEWCGKK